jgi:oligopeptide transport system ATP-binding protein
MEVKDLTTRFHTQEGIVYAVNGISYTINEGETLGVVGESGSGKSVQSLSIMGLIPQPPGKVEAGSVMFKGRDLLNLSKEELRQIRGAEIAMIFQDPMTSLNPVLTVGRQITEALRLHLGMTEKQARERAAELLAMVGIPMAAQRLDNYPHQFSGGMRQRAMIAMALSCNPQLLIADEPTTALDVTIQAQIVELVKRLRDKLGMSMIWISHDLGVIAGLADTVQVMYAGFIVERGAVGEVFNDTRHPYTLGLKNSLPRVDQRGEKLIPIEGSPPDMRKKPTGCPFVPRCRFSIDICHVENPPLKPVIDSIPNHVAACHVDIRTAPTHEPARNGVAAERIASNGQ